ncbi:Peptide-N4-(N-acetyl-beta-glucosaminyl)asparagine amidase A, partial [Candida tropicalis]
MSFQDKNPDEEYSFPQAELPPYSDISNTVDEEKQSFLNDDKKENYENSPSLKVARSSDKLKRFCQVFSLIGVLYLVNFVYFNFSDFQNGLSRYNFNLGCNKPPTKPLEQHPIFRNLIDIVDTSYSEEEGEDIASKGKQIISVTNPFVPKPFYGKSVYSSKLLHHKFGNSWGKPAVVNFTVPTNISFEAVVLTLHTEVDGVQFDRLANLFVDGVQVWRTSTIEPSGRKKFSDFKKDISKYSKLFKKDNVQILFQLDNLLTDKLTGVFDVTLSVDFYDFHGFGPHHHDRPHHKRPHHRKEQNDVNEKREYEGDSDD